MFTINPFSELSGFISPLTMQVYVIAMVLLVVGGTILDMIHKKSAQYFFENSKKQQENATRTVSSGEKASMAVKTVANEVLTSSEFSNPKRRISHLFTMYGFILFVATTAIMIFGYTSPDATTPVILPLLWHLGALMLCFGGYWFWFFIRVDVFAEGKLFFTNMEGSELSDYRRTIPRLADLQIDMLFPGHKVFCLSDGQRAIDIAIENLEKIRLPPNFV
jgi:hypothetical protein